MLFAFNREQEVEPARIITSGIDWWRDVKWSMSTGNMGAEMSISGDESKTTWFFFPAIKAARNRQGTQERKSATAVVGAMLATTRSVTLIEMNTSLKSTGGLWSSFLLAKTRLLPRHKPGYLLCDLRINHQLQFSVYNSCLWEVLGEPCLETTMQGTLKCLYLM